MSNSKDAVRKILDAVKADKRTSLTAPEGKLVCDAYGIPVPKEGVAKSAAEASKIATAMGFPVVMKIVSPDILHKTEAGGVRLGLSTPEDVRKAAEDIQASALRYAPQARIDGISVQQMVPPGVEIVLGVKNDRQFGPLIAAGLGGIMVELLGDTAVRLAPVNGQTARAMLASLKGRALLTGFRGKPGVDIDGLVDTICRLSELAHDLRDIVDQIDINPVIAGAGGVMAADALIVCR